MLQQWNIAQWTKPNVMGIERVEMLTKVEQHASREKDNLMLIDYSSDF